MVRCKLLWGKVNPLHVIAIYAVKGTQEAYKSGKRTFVDVAGSGRWEATQPQDEVRAEFERCLSTCVHQVIDREVIVEKLVPKLVSIPMEFEPVMSDVGIVLEWVEQSLLGQPLGRNYMKRGESEALKRVMQQILATRPQGEK